MKTSHDLNYAARHFDSRNSQGNSANNPSTWHDEPRPEDITLGWVLKRLFMGLKLIFTALKYKLYAVLGKKKGQGFSFPWFKLGLFVTALVFLTQKDIKFSINLKAPLGDTFAFSSPFADNKEQLGLGDIIPLVSPGSPSFNIQQLDDRKVDAFVDRFGKVAVAEMRKFGIPASVKLAQGILETKAEVNIPDNNYFGAPLQQASYISAWENWRAHSILLKSNFSQVADDAYGYKQWAKGLEKAGYHKDSRYAENLIAIIEKYQLNKFDY
jgi:hypothetical protein